MSGQFDPSVKKLVGRTVRFEPLETTSGAVEEAAQQAESDDDPEAVQLQTANDDEAPTRA